MWFSRKTWVLETSAEENLWDQWQSAQTLSILETNKKTEFGALQST